ncbi:MAG: STAS/SEC14 domain-containing protein [Phycisphaerae bacterium]|nr:STAS/SEC14 domain-containing protein [Saprospiraceae bacterium]
MASSTANIRELLTSAEQLDTKELSTFSIKVSEMLAKRPRIGLPKQEARLMLRINAGLPIELLEHTAALHEKRRDENLSPSEQEELLHLSAKIEALHIERMKLLLKLAQLRGVSLRSLMNELGITPYMAHG